jgi:hypothetical protein
MSSPLSSPPTAINPGTGCVAAIRPLAILAAMRNLFRSIAVLLALHTGTSSSRPISTNANAGIYDASALIVAQELAINFGRTASIGDSTATNMRDATAMVAAR